jgi:hypothetical protein
MRLWSRPFSISGEMQVIGGTSGLCGLDKSLEKRVLLARLWRAFLGWGVVATSSPLRGLLGVFFLGLFPGCFYLLSARLAAMI